MKAKPLGIALIFFALVIAAIVAYRTSEQSEVPMIFAPRTMLSGLWHEYKLAYVEDGRTIDRQRDDVTTSEGQSYTMLRAAWMDDKETFDSAWDWTKANMQREDDSLFAWLYGKRPDGTYGVMSEIGGQNSASDADTDIAVALLFAYSRWRDLPYLQAARDIVADIWEKEVVTVNGRPVLASNNLEKTSTEPQILVNPSYFAPYAYRMFAELDPDHDWEALITSSYDLIRRSTASPLDAERSAQLPPDWILVDRKTGEVSSGARNFKSTYGYEAARLPWRLALDWEWYREPRAQETLAMFDFLKLQWEEGRRIYATYGHDGEVLGDYEAPAIYGGSMGYFVVRAPDRGAELYAKKLRALYSPDILGWERPMSYYDTNWAWFGLALYHGFAVNLSPFADNPSHNPTAKLLSYSFALLTRKKY